MKKWNNKLWQKESIMVKPGDVYQINIVVCNKYYNYFSTPRNKTTTKIHTSRTDNKFAQANDKLKLVWLSKPKS